MNTGLDANTRISLSPAQLWSIVTSLVVAAAYVTYAYVSLKNGQEELARMVGKAESRNLTSHDWDVMLYLIYRKNPDMKIDFPTSVEIRAARE